MRPLLVAGNWKMNGSMASARKLVTGLVEGHNDIQNVELAVFPPFVYLAEIERLLTNTPISWGAQNLSEQQAGAYTGEIAAGMLKDFNCKYVLVGHSERRTLYGESDALVANKFAAAKRSGIIPILCLGETLEERERGTTEAVVARQLDAVLKQEGIQAINNAIIAYEPVWAIGTGKTASPQQAQEVHSFIRSKIAEHDGMIGDSVCILYGGSVKSANAVELFAMPDIDGGLVGGASLDANEFLQIAKAAM